MTLLYTPLNHKFGKKVSGTAKRAIAEGFKKNFLKLKNAVSSSTPVPSALRSKVSTKSVIIVGGGFAGLSAANHLISSGFTVTILEARDRVGGRAHSLNDFCKGRIIEAGGENIGVNHPNWIDLAIEFGLGLHVNPSEDNFEAAKLAMPIYVNGKILTETEAEKLYQDLTKIYGKLTILASEIKDANAPWKTLNAKKWDAMSLGDWLDKQAKPKTLLRIALEFDFSNNNGVSTYNQSFLAILSQIKGGGLENYWTLSEVFSCENGSQGLANALSEKITSSNNGVIALNTAAKSVTIEKNNVTVITNNGKTHIADYIILAVPPSTWSKIVISPAIPKAYEMQMGAIVKYLSKMNNRFWIKNNLSPNAMVQAFGITWEGTKNQTIQKSQEVELTVFAGGEDAEKAINSNDRDKYFSSNISKIYSSFPQNNIAGKFISWPEEEWTNGGYSIPNVNQVCSIGPFLNKAYNERMFFAGEHTSMAFYGYMEGALQSGLHAAIRIGMSESVVTLPKGTKL